MNQRLTNKTVLILGLGASGLAMAKWVAQCGAKVVVQDTRITPPQLTNLQKEVPDAQFIAAPFSPDLLTDRKIGAVFVSPGIVPISYQTLKEAALAQGLVWGNELSLFIDAMDQLKEERGYGPKIVAITGTNGKTTVTSLCAHLIASAGYNVKIAGNIGPTLLNTLSQAWQENNLPQVWCLELSSFQLEGITHFNPNAATILNLTQDHLDWHESMADYLKAKTNIFGINTVRVLNRDDALVRQLQSGIKNNKGDKQLIAWKSFGSDIPKHPGDYGLEQTNGMAWLVKADESETPSTKKKSKSIEEIHLKRLIPQEALRILGQHNACNALAALALCQSIGCSLAPMLYGLQEFLGQPHRMQSVGILHGVEYFDDSKGTNVGASVTAINSLGVNRKLVVILGGDGKGQDFSPLKEPLHKYVKLVILIGKDAKKIAAAIQPLAIDACFCIDMQEAVTQAFKVAHSGDAVLLSPACASWGMYRNYEHRASEFISAVQEIAMQTGVILETSL